MNHSCQLHFSHFYYSVPQVGSAATMSCSAIPITLPGWKFPLNPHLDFFLCCMHGSKDNIRSEILWAVIVAAGQEATRFLYSPDKPGQTSLDLSSRSF